MTENNSSANFLVRHQTKILVSLLAITAALATYQAIALQRYKKMVDKLLAKAYPDDYPKG